MSDRKQVNVNEAALDWLREHDQPINDAPQPAATECPQCGGEKNNPCFLWTQTTGWGDVECGPKCANIFHNAPTPPASQPTVTLDRETVRAYPGVCSGRPLVGGVPLFTIQSRFLAGESISSIAEDFELSVCSVENGLRYALENDVNEPALALLRAAEQK